MGVGGDTGEKERRGREGTDKPLVGLDRRFQVGDRYADIGDREKSVENKKKEGWGKEDSRDPPCRHRGRLPGLVVETYQSAFRCRSARRGEKGGGKKKRIEASSFGRRRADRAEGMRRGKRKRSGKFPHEPRVPGMHPSPSRATEHKGGKS